MAEERLQPLFDQFAKEAPQRFPKGVRPLVRPLVETHTATDFAPTLLLIFAASMLLLLLACANVSILLLARGTSRAHEFTVGAAIGASRGRLMRQLIVESLLLALSGAALGVAAGYWACRLSSGSCPPIRFRSGTSSQGMLGLRSWLTSLDNFRNWLIRSA